MENYSFPVPLNLIVAEDESASSLYIKTLLKRYVSGNVWMAKDGLEAWNYFQQNKDNIDLILTDINMPQMDGIELSRRIRSLDNTIPIVITTAFDNTSLLREAIEIGVYQYILKPVQSKQIEQVLFDIFKRKINAIRLKEQQEYNKILSKALEDSISMIAILDHEHKIQFVNKSFREFLRTSLDKFIGKKITEFAFDAQNPDEFQKFIDSVENNQSYAGEILFINSLGEPFWGMITHTPFFNENNQYTYAVDIIEDITAKKLAQEQLRQHKETLEKIIERRTQELIILNNQLKEEIEKRIKYELELAEAKEYAEKANEAKSIFLAKVSHELRTPMNGILGITSIMKDMKLDDKSAKFVDIIHTSAQNLLNIINDLLDFSKIKSGKFTLAPRYFNFFEEINQTIDLLKPIATNKSLEIVANIDEKIPPKLYGDIDRIKQVLWNILSNAIKFTKEGFISVQIKLNSIVDKKAEIEFIVQDTGIGIPDNKKDAIFESFMQAEPLMTRNFGGTGLGLSISKEIIDLMEGTIYFESKLGKGTTFFYTMKINLEEPQIDIKQKIDEKVNLDSENKNLNYFLVVEPDINTQKSIEELLSETNIKIFFAENHFEAIDIFKVNPTDVIIISTDIGNNNFFKLVETIRTIEIEFKKHFPIVALYNASEPINCDYFNSKGVDYFLEKPIKIKSLTETLNEISIRKTKHFIEIDLEELINSNSKEVIQKIIDYFIKNYKPLLQNLDKAIKENNYRKIYEYANQIRSQISNFGVFRSVQIATRIAKKAIENDGKNLDVLFNALNWEIENIVNYLNQNQIEKLKVKNEISNSRR